MTLHLLTVHVVQIQLGRVDDVGAEDEVVIVDTNNIAELPPSVNEAKIVEVIDHHMLQGGLKTRAPGVWLSAVSRRLRSLAGLMSGAAAMRPWTTVSRRLFRWPPISSISTSRWSCTAWPMQA